MTFRWKNKTEAGQKFVCRPACIPEPSESARKVLLVDDDPVVLTALSLKLKASGFRVITARDGAQALAATRKENPDLMVLDVNFPPDVGGVEWNGFSLAEWLRRLDGDRRVPFIVMSASEQADYPQRATSVGASAFLRKPLNSDELFASIDLALKNPAQNKPAGAIQTVQT